MSLLLTSSLSSLSDAPVLGFGGWLEAASKIDAYALGVVVAFVAIVFLLRLAVPKVGAIAWVTAKETLQQPLFLIHFVKVSTYSFCSFALGKEISFYRGYVLSRRGAQ